MEGRLRIHAPQSPTHTQIHTSRYTHAHMQMCTGKHTMYACTHITHAHTHRSEAVWALPIQEMRHAGPNCQESPPVPRCVLTSSSVMLSGALSLGRGASTCWCCTYGPYLWQAGRQQIRHMRCYVRIWVQMHTGGWPGFAMWMDWLQPTYDNAPVFGQLASCTCSGSCLMMQHVILEHFAATDDLCA